ncbi:ABC transporter permease [Paenibacillus contaminans]|uniref:Sugar ABC transporter permease n=1 Tax=Paenibacillus contaminans TaxID=450362 RepID=A0A329MXE1_9BACL|nr:ABC transporter permease subunit [Paenibacillus contaminans]RAV23073.1 sugar ABC transporter permease [Paenibacillus contaminans]
MILPSLIIVLIFSYGPMAGVVIAFKKFLPAKGIFSSPWVGWENFEYVMLMPDTMRVMTNTIVIAVMKMVLGLIVPVTAALLLNEVRKAAFRRTFQTLVYLPHFLSWVILSGILIDILSPTSGIVNQALGWFGIEPIYFLGDNHWFRFTIVLSDIWKEFGFGTIVYLAALTGISPTLYEAAEADGAGRLRQIWHISLPGMTPIVVLMAVLSLGNILNAGFDQIFNLYSPQVYESGDIIDTLVYRLGLQQFQYGVATAVGLFKSVISFILISVSYYLAYRLANYRIF